MIPEPMSKEYGPYLLDKVRRGEATYVWEPLYYEAGGQRVALLVFGAPLVIDDLYVSVTAHQQQQIADLLGASLLTPLVSDRMWAARAWTLAPVTLPPDNRMASLGMLREATRLWKERQKAVGYTGQGITAMGKHWALGNHKAPKARNYGLYIPQARAQGYAPATPYAGTQVWQPPGTAHDFAHLDYSQLCTLMLRRCWIDDVEYDVREVLRDPKLAPLLSHEGVVAVRQPGVPELESLQSLAEKAGELC